jgi:hypothetical protein
MNDSLWVSAAVSPTITLQNNYAKLFYPEEFFVVMIEK